MDRVHVGRHHVLVEGRTQRAIARELGLARVTVRKYVPPAAPTRKGEAAPRPRPVWDAVAGRVMALERELRQAQARIQVAEERAALAEPPRTVGAPMG